MNAVGTAPEKKYDACTRASDGVPAPARGPSSACARCRMGSVADTVVLDVPDASVGDAVMMLDLRHTNALLFKNSGTGAFNMVYRRDDGTIGWVEPQREASRA